MDVRKMVAELASQLSEINYDSEEDNVVFEDSTNNILLDDSDNNANFEPSKLMKSLESITLPEKIYGGKTTTRKHTYPLTDSGSDNEDISSMESSGISDADDVESESNLESEADYSHAVDSSETHPQKMNTTNADIKRDCNIYSAENRNTSNDPKKGAAIRNQLRIWESLLECRIKLQKSLSAANSLPATADMAAVKQQLSSDDQLKLNRCKKNLLILLNKIVELQKELMNHCNGSRKNRELNTNDLDEEIRSDESEIEDDKEENEEEDQPIKKKRKLNDYSAILKDKYNNFIPYRNDSIEKWNDKTKVSTGKMANANFSAFDQSTLKQIEQIMADKSRLINRTQIKRNNCHSSSINEQGDTALNSKEITLDPEIFDDSDFYHKLLRDYIERKSTDVTNSSHTERQLIELQKLRSKMKKNVDTKSTKGRKLRYVVLPKLVNFMAPDPYNSWNEQSETELFNSLFGKIQV